MLGERLRMLRKEKNLSQADIEERTGLLRSYVSRVENGHTVPSVETLEKIARALEIPLYQLFYEGDQPPRITSWQTQRDTSEAKWAQSGEGASLFARLRQLLRHIGEQDRELLMFVALKMARKNRS
jgi:transcriptional regulator with XRE-family HTH domain